MRSLAGLAAIVAAASVYLYLLSTHLPPGPEHLPSEGEDQGVHEYRYGQKSYTVKKKEIINKKKYIYIATTIEIYINLVISFALLNSTVIQLGVTVKSKKWFYHVLFL